MTGQTQPDPELLGVGNHPTPEDGRLNYLFGRAPTQLLRRQVSEGSTWRQYLIGAGAVIAITLAFLFGPSLGQRAIALIYLFAVVVLASSVGRGPTLLAATMSALLWDYFFMEPIHTFRVTHFEDALLLGMYFVVALVLGQLTARIRAQEKTERQGQERAVALYLLTRELTEADGLDQMLQKAVHHMERIFKAQIAVLLPDLANQLRPPPGSTNTFVIADDEQSAAEWAFQQGHPAGKFTGQFPRAQALYVPLTAGGGTAGVIGLRFRQSFFPTLHQRNLLAAAAQQIALALDRHRLRAASEKTKLLAESERLSKNLLNSMSHEIRTPIAVINSAASNLGELPETGLSPSQQGMVGEIQQATERLNRLVGNVLDITRLESGHVKPRRDECDVGDLVHMAVKETRKQLAHHPLTINVGTGLPLVCMDYVLMQHALTNLLSNAAFHTPEGTAVQLTARLDGDALVLVVADRGPGIPPESMTRIFNKFYRGPNARTGGTGLGLSLVKGFVEAQGGQVQAENRAGGGVSFTIRLPLGKIPAALVESSL